MKFLHNISRIEAFSDAVFAFAAILMVVSLELGSDFSVLNISLSNFVSFAISFFVLIFLWKIHYNFFRRTNYVDNWIITFNSIFLFVVLYYVFPLKSLVNSFFTNDGLTANSLSKLFELYGIGFFLIFLCFSLMYWRAYKNTKIIEHSVELLFFTRHFAIFSIAALLSILLSFTRLGLNYGAPGFLYALLGPLCYLHANWFSKNVRNKLL